MRKLLALYPASLAVRDIIAIAQDSVRPVLQGPQITVVRRLVTPSAG